MSKPNRISPIILASAGGPQYPVVTGGYMWLDRHVNVFTDVAGTVPAVPGTDLIASWGSVGGAWNEILLTQPTGSKRPILGVDGIKTDGSDDELVLPAFINISADFTIYWVSNRGHGAVCYALGGNGGAGAFGYILAKNTDICEMCVNSGASASAGANNFSGTAINRLRRSGTGIHFKNPSDAEGSGTLGTSFAATRIFRAPSSGVNSSSIRFMQLVVVLANIAPDSAADLAIRAKLLELEPTATDCG